MARSSTVKVSDTCSAPQLHPLSGLLARAVLMPSFALSECRQLLFWMMVSAQVVSFFCAVEVFQRQPALLTLPNPWPANYAECASLAASFRCPLLLNLVERGCLLLRSCL